MNNKYDNFDNDDYNNDNNDDGRDYSFISIPLHYILNAINESNNAFPIGTSNEIFQDSIKPKVIASLFNEEYLLYFINQIENSNNMTILLECAPNPKYEPSKSILDVYSYLKTSHYLNFLLSAYYGIGIWDHECVDLQVETAYSINTDGKKRIDDYNYSKIVIVINTSNVPNEVINEINNLYFKKETEVITKIPGSPLLSTAIFGKSYYLPLSVVELTLAFNTDSVITFDDINIDTFYRQILRKYINQVIDQYYCIRDTEESLINLGDKLVKIHFTISMETRLCRIIFIVMPVIYCYDSKIYNYSLSSHTMHSIESSYTNLPALLNFINSISSTDVSQVFLPNAINVGVHSMFSKDYTLLTSKILIFSPQRIINTPDNSSIIQFNNFREEHSNYNQIKAYWVPNTVVIYNDDTPAYSRKLHFIGFINCNSTELDIMKYDELFNLINDELVTYFNISTKDILSDKVRFQCCYSTKSIIRIILFRIIDNNKCDESISITNEKPKKKHTKFLPW